MYGKSTQTAIAALSRLAEVYDGGETRLSATEIADARGLQRPFVSKVLSTLSQAEVVEGTRGPGGGFSFALPPKQVTLYDVYVLFEQDSVAENCPFGGGICGNGGKCPMHDRLLSVRKANREVLNTTFDCFRLAFKRNKGQAKWQYGVTLGSTRYPDRKP